MINVDLKMPESWDQLSRKQLLYVCRLLNLNLSELKFKAWVFIRFTGIKPLPKKVFSDRVYYFFRKKNTRFFLTPDEFHWFCNSANFLLSESKLTKNNFPVFRILWKRFFGPSNCCYNISVMEFLVAERMIDAFHKTNQLKYLHLLCAILYRRQSRAHRPNTSNYNGDRREPFNDYTFEKRERWFCLLPVSKLFAVYVFFTGCRNLLIEKYPYLFNTQNVSSEPVNHAEILKQVMVALNQGDLTKNKVIRQTQLWEAFGHLNELAKQAQKVKKV
jgi:hypothetical protein